MQGFVPYTLSAFRSFVFFFWGWYAVGLSFLVGELIFLDTAHAIPQPCLFHYKEMAVLQRGAPGGKCKCNLVMLLWRTDLSCCKCKLVMLLFFEVVKLLVFLVILANFIEGAGHDAGAGATLYDGMVYQARKVQALVVVTDLSLFPCLDYKCGFLPCFS